MSYITKDKNTMFKDERNKITINKQLFAFASDFSDSYFANDLNWKKIAVHFRHTTSNQKKIIVLMSDSNSGWFEASALARTGNWEIKEILVFDKDGDFTSVPRTDMPNPESFDISTATKVAPSELIVSFQDAFNPILGSGKTELYRVGYKVVVWDEVLNQQHNATVYTITAINEDKITLNMHVNDFSGKTLRLRFPAFRNSSAEQRSLFQYVGTGFGAIINPDPIVLPPAITLVPVLTGDFTGTSRPAGWTYSVAVDFSNGYAAFGSNYAQLGSQIGLSTLIPYTNYIVRFHIKDVIYTGGFKPAFSFSLGSNTSPVLNYDDHLFPSIGSYVDIPVQSGHINSSNWEFQLNSIPTNSTAEIQITKIEFFPA